MDYKNMILLTKSVREYNKNVVDTQTLKTIKDYSQNCPKIDNSISFDVRILNNEVFIALDGIAGYKGNMIDAPHYILILSDKKEHYIENAAYIGESMILKATELGIASCWITFQDSQSIKEHLNIISEKEVVALIALGYDANASKSKSIPSFHYKLGLDEIVYIDKWGNGADASILEERGLLEAFAFSKFAPSSLNKQPWRFLLTGGKVVLAVKKEKDISDYEQKIDTGIIMLFFQSIVSSTLFDLKWHLEKPVDFLKIPKDFEISAYCML